MKNKSSFKVKMQRQGRITLPKEIVKEDCLNENQKSVVTWMKGKPALIFKKGKRDLSNFGPRDYLRIISESETRFT